jgi:hypothetical protein
MPAQLFLGSGDGRFTLFDGGGDFFSMPRLGRALAKLDFNRDGLMDLVFNDLESPVSLVRNESLASGSFISLRLVGTQSDRNAFCTTAELRITGGDPETAAASSEYRQRQQLIAGSGYHASNERRLHFSIPLQELAENNESSLKLTIRWPSGVVEEYDGLRMSSHYTAIEGGGLHPTP